MLPDEPLVCPCSSTLPLLACFVICMRTSFWISAVLGVPGFFVETHAFTAPPR